MSVGDPISLWEATASVPRPAFPALTNDLNVDVAIVGGGFTGLSTALHLAEAGATVGLVEAGEVGHGASGRNGGQANPGVKLGREDLEKRFGEDGRGLSVLGEEAVDFLADLISRKGLRASLQRTGVIRLAHSEPAMKTMAAAKADLIRRGIPAVALSAEDVATRVGTRRYLGGLLDPRGGNIHPLDLARELARAATENGAQLFTKTRAVSAERSGDAWTVRTSTGGSLRARQVAVVTNGYTDDLVPGLARSVLPVNSFQVSTGVVPKDISRTILPGGQAVYDSRRLILYFRKSPDGRVVMGGRASFSSAAGGLNRASDYAVLGRVMTNVFPQLEGVSIAQSWTGLVCITPDFLPHYHVPEPDMHCVLGFNGRGVALSNRAGAWLANKLLGRVDAGAIPRTPISPIPFHQFRAPVLNAVMRWNAAMDRLGF